VVGREYWGMERDPTQTWEPGVWPISSALWTQKGLATSSSEPILLFILSFLLIFIPFYREGTQPISLFVTRTSVLLLLTVWVLAQIRRGSLILSRSRLDTWIILFICWAWASLFLSEYKYASFLEIADFFTYLMVFDASRFVFNRERYKPALGWVLIAGINLQLALSIYGYFYDRAPVSRTGFLSPNNFACFLVIGFTLLLSLVLLGPKTPFFVKLICSLNILVLGFMIITLRSRGAFLGLVVGTLGPMWVKGKKWIFVTSLIVLGILVIPNFITQYVFWSKAADPYAYERINIWKASLKMLRDHPIWGIGLGMYRNYADQYNFPVEGQVGRYGKVAWSAHNDVLQVGVELGVMGLVLLGGIAVLILYQGVKKASKGPPSWYLAGSVCALGAILVQSLVNEVLHSPAIAMATATLAAMVVDNPTGKASKSIPVFSLRLCRIGFLLLVCCVFLFMVGFPFLGDLYYTQAEKFMSANQPAQTLEALKKAIRYVPIRADYYNSLGEIYLQALEIQFDDELFRSAEGAFSKAIRLNPREMMFHMNRAALYRQAFASMKTEQVARIAVEEYQKAIELAPFIPFPRFDLAFFYTEMGRYQEARKLLEEAVDLEPNFIWGHYLLGQVLFSLGQEEASRKEVEKGLNLESKYDVNQYSYSPYLRNLLRPWAVDR